MTARRAEKRSTHSPTDRLDVYGPMPEDANAVPVRGVMSDLFDGAYPDPPVVDTKLSAGRRLTLRQKADVHDVSGAAIWSRSSARPSGVSSARRSTAASASTAARTASRTSATASVRPTRPCHSSEPVEWREARP